MIEPTEEDVAAVRRAMDASLNCKTINWGDDDEVARFIAKDLDLAGLRAKIRELEEKS